MLSHILPEDAGPGTVHQSETHEREAAWMRGKMFRESVNNVPQLLKTSVREANPAFAALAENVRDYAIFLMDPDGVIVYWGKGAHLIKWWTDEEAEGGHLRMLYPEGGSEDGTAEDHLRQSAETGEYSGEGQRVRADLSTFWAHVTLTALRDPQGTLIGFAKTTRDMTTRRAAETALARSHASEAALEVALRRVEKTQADLERVGEEADFAQEKARGAEEYVAQALEDVRRVVDARLEVKDEAAGQ